MKKVLLSVIMLSTAGLCSAANLLHYWKMDETAASPGFAQLEAGGTALTATVVNEVTGGVAATFIKGAVADPAPFYGTGSVSNALGTQSRLARISLGNVSPTTNSFTIALWFKRNSQGVSGHDVGHDQTHILSGNQGQAGRWNLYTASFNATNETFALRFFHNGGIGDAGVATGLQSDRWYHFAATRDSANLLKIYLDGVEVYSNTDAGTFTNGSNGVWLGRDPGLRANGERGFIGTFDDVRIYDKAINPLDIKSLGLPLARAYNPTPLLDAVGVAVNTPVAFQWNMAMDPNNLSNINPNVTKHYLYLYTDPNFATVTPIQIAAGTPAGATSAYAATLQTDKIYYWRVDESINQSGSTDANTIIGPMWKFETVKSVPVITGEPVSVLLDQVGQVAVFNLEADSLSVPKYYWYKSADIANNTPDNDTLVGTNSNVLSFSSAQLADEGFYFCKVVNASGEASSAYSAVARLGFKQFMAHWTMDQARFIGNQYLDEKNNHSADPNSPAAVAFVGGISGMDNGAIVIDAANSWANAGVWTPDAYTDQITLSAWVKWNGSALVGDGPGIISKRKADGGNWWSLYARNGDAGHIGNVWIRFSSFNDGDVWAGPNALVANEWTHVVATVDGAKAGHVFVNGLKKATDTTWSFGTVANMDAPVMIGAALADGTSPFLGALDDIQIYNYALTDLDIAKMYTTLSGDKVCMPSQKPDAKFDLNGDCIVDMTDFAQFALSWLQCGLVPDCIE